MPDVATTVTATATQTQAAGTRILGYYLGGGVVKVALILAAALLLGGCDQSEAAVKKMAIFDRG